MGHSLAAAKLDQELELAVTLASLFAGKSPLESSLPFYLVAIVVASLAAGWLALCICGALAIRRRLGGLYSSVPRDDLQQCAQGLGPPVQAPRQADSHESDAPIEAAGLPPHSYPNVYQEEEEGIPGGAGGISAARSCHHLCGEHGGVDGVMLHEAAGAPDLRNTPDLAVYEATLYRVPGESLGLDMQLDPQTRTQWRVSRIKFGSPAERSGQLRVGDLVWSINGCVLTPDVSPAEFMPPGDWRVRVGVLR
jgi:hypothetical protein